MTIRHPLTILGTLFLAAAVGCSSSDNNGGTGGGGGASDGGGASGGAGSGVNAGGSDAGTEGGAILDGSPPAADVVTTGECAKAANAAHTAALLAAQPTVTVKASSGKTVITSAIAFTSLADDSAQTCTVSLQFRDLNGNGTLEPYENWTLTAAARADDLVARMTSAQKLALMAHASLTDTPTTAASTPSTATQAVIDAGIRFGRTNANTALVSARATWANAIQERAEASAFGIPFVLSMEPAHSSGNGRTHAKGFSQWPNELGIGATGDPSVALKYGQVVSQEYRAIGVRMALSPAGNLATDPRWYGAQFSFGEDPTTVSAMLKQFVTGLQGTTLGASSVAAVVGHFPGAGATTGGFDARLAKGKSSAYSGTDFDTQVAAFQGAFDAGAMGIVAGYGIPATGTWTGLSGQVSGAAIEQVGASFNKTLLTDVLRTHYAYSGLVLAPEGVLDDAGGTALGAPWGMETATRAERVAKAVTAGADQFLGLGSTTDLAAASLTDAQVNASATRALTLIFQLGLFENPYVDASKAPSLCNADTSYQAGLDAMDRGMVLLLNKAKPTGWLDGTGDGTQVADKGNAGNGSGKVIPAPPGEPYVAAGCDYYVAGDFDLDYIRSVSAGYGTLTNDATSVKSVAVSTAAERMALSDYIFVRIASPFVSDPDSGALAQPLASLEYANTTPATLDPVAAARAAIASWTGTPASQAQIIVIVDSGRPSVMTELLSSTYNISGLYLNWMGDLASGNASADKIVLDVAFGIVDGKGTLPVGLPASDLAAATQLPATAGDGQDTTFVRGYGLLSSHF